MKLSIFKMGLVRAKSLRMMGSSYSLDCFICSSKDLYHTIKLGFLTLAPTTNVIWDDVPSPIE